MCLRIMWARIAKIESSSINRDCNAPKTKESSYDNFGAVYEWYIW